MKDSGLLWLLLGAGVVYFAYKQGWFGSSAAPAPATTTTIPLGGGATATVPTSLLTQAIQPKQSCPSGTVWGPIPGIIPSWGCVTPEVAAMKGVG